MAHTDREPVAAEPAAAGSRSHHRHHERPSHSTYGYHNTFHTHATPSMTESAPPNYDVATSRVSYCTPSARQQVDEVLPPYSCSVLQSGPLEVRCELASPFMESDDQKWHQVYAHLRGTQLSIHRLKTGRLFSSRDKAPEIGRLIRSYTLQHAEIGVAVDHNKDELIPKSAFAKLLPPAARQKLFETDPNYFEPVREWVIRLRLETEQLLLCTTSQSTMLDWIESLCAAIDISPPIEDRSDPRYRSLPRRNRRQRQIEGLPENLDNLNDDAAGRRLLEQQERLLRRLCPNLAAEEQDRQTSSQRQRDIESAQNDQAGDGGDPDADDLDPADVREGSRPASPGRTSSDLSRPSANGGSDSRPSSSSTPSGPERRAYDPKTATRVHTQSRSSLMRYRRRCAPVLFQMSPRAGDVVFSNGKRMRIDNTNFRLVPFELAPPHYDVGTYKKSQSMLAAVAEDYVSAAPPASTATARPLLDRTGSDESTLSASDDALILDAPALHTSSTSSSLTDYAASSSTDSEASVPSSPTSLVIPMSPTPSTSSKKSGVLTMRPRVKDMALDSVAATVVPAVPAIAA